MNTVPPHNMTALRQIDTPVSRPTVGVKARQQGVTHNQRLHQAAADESVATNNRHARRAAAAKQRRK